MNNSNETGYSMPPAYVGQVVLWKSDVSSRGAAAIVTEVGNRALHLSVLQPGLQNAQCSDGVLHVSDPMADRPDRDEGVWDYTDGDKSLHRILQQLRPQAANNNKKAAAKSS